MTIEQWWEWEPDPLAVIYGVKPIQLGLNIVPNHEARERSKP
jgi:hypothetical protein